MESIAIGLNSSDIKARESALDNLTQKLQKGKRGCVFDLPPSETKTRVYSACVSLLRDTNAKIVCSSFNVIFSIIEDASFQNLKAMFFWYFPYVIIVFP